MPPPFYHSLIIISCLKRLSHLRRLLKQFSSSFFLSFFLSSSCLGVTAHGKDCQCRKKVQRHWKTKYNPKFTVESKKLKVKWFDEPLKRCQQTHTTNSAQFSRHFGLFGTGPPKELVKTLYILSFWILQWILD